MNASSRPEVRMLGKLDLRRDGKLITIASRPPNHCLLT
jgi:hypothetical protein